MNEKYKRAATQNYVFMKEQGFKHLLKQKIALHTLTHFFKGHFCDPTHDQKMGKFQPS